MRINPDTKDALLFLTGLLGMVAQGVLAAFGISPSLPLIGAWLTMCGIGVVSSVFGGQSYEPRRGPNDDPPPARRLKRKTRSPAERRGSTDAP